MIEKYCHKKNIVFEYIENTDYITKIRIESSGEVFKHLNGFHKLVRVSPFGKGDKTHTSLCKINVLNPPKEFNIQIQEKDIRMDFFKSTGPGGQHRNKVMSAVRLLHLPTNTMVTSDSSRSQHDNRKYAYDLLLCKLDEIWKEKQDKERIESRKNMKEDVVATYYFNHQMAVHEKIGNKTTSLKSLLNGELELIFKN